jgi:hypothetical protein
LDGSGISILSTISFGKAFGSGAPASCFGEEEEWCGNIESETTVFSIPRCEYAILEPEPASPASNRQGYRFLRLPMN